ncbi:hypothetical protein PNOK_0731000 [Pyrrhoderma noxium]|uniref:Ricin B lectin domain-containing protein n=1 Tax=Pyrrhoderma noxium TaxID=2282107 RepID=A0A286UCF7_9AGAM|nr:hypothetical protein PNOK_0731000 [Pyrrhoderma noxium]
MAPTALRPNALNFTQLASLAANAVVPSAGKTFALHNLAFDHVLDNAGGQTFDGNEILAWSLNVPATQNQQWTYLDYPSTEGDTVFTLQVLSTEDSAATKQGRGGYLRIDPTTNLLVHGGQPLAWKLIEAAPNIFKMSPFDDVFSGNGALVATDRNSAILSPTINQVALENDVNELAQFWTFGAL